MKNGTSKKQIFDEDEAVARRLQALGAITKGDRRAEIGALDAFNFDTTWGKRALRQMLNGLFEGASSVPAVRT